MSGEHAGPAATVAARVRHLEALLEQRGLVDSRELDRALEAFLARASPANGAHVVARAWLDEGFRARLLADANAALPELGLSMGGGLQEQRLKVVENTEGRHNVIVCTLCSCYPIALLGPSPTAGPARGLARVRLRAGSGGADQRLGRQRGVPLHGPAPPTRRHRGSGRAGAGGAGHPQRPDRRRAHLNRCGRDRHSLNRNRSQAGRRCSSQIVAPSAAAVSATNRPASMNWKVQNRSAGW